MNRLSLFIFAFTIYILLDYYIFQAVKVVFSASSTSVKSIVYGLYWSLTVFSILAIVAFIKTGPTYPSLRTVLGTLLIMNLMGKIFAGLFLFADDIIRVSKYAFIGLFQNGIKDTTTGSGLSRSDFLAKSALIAGTIPMATMSFGILSGAYDYRVRKKTIVLKNLPSAFDGMRIAQLSDIHSGSFYNKTAVQGGVDMLINEKPDLFLFTGDLVNNESKEVGEYLDTFSKIKAPIGNFSVLGNHDYGDYKSWTSPQEKKKNLQDLIESHKSMGWDILLNEHRYIEVGGERLAIIGVENWGAKGFTKYGNLDLATQNVEADTKILLSHDPSHWDAQIRPQHSDIDLTLAGHTHGFQFGVEIGNFRWSPSQYMYKQWADLYTEGDQHLYVNRGFGFLGYPGRIGILPEITILELKKA